MEIKAVTHLGRFKDIVLVLFKYGFDDLVERLDLPGKMIIEKLPGVHHGMSTWTRARLTLEELGPTFIKFGQLLSLRPDLVPADLILELRKLQDDVAPVPFAEIREIVEAGLKQPLDKVFKLFEEKPLAAASLAQVHRGILLEGNQAVAVKVQRPEIDKIIDTDLYIFEAIVGKLHEKMEDLRIYALPDLLSEFKKNLLRELDFSREARNMKISQRNFADTPNVRIPKLFEEYCTDQIITMELLRGSKLRELDGNLEVDRKELAKTGLRLTMKQVLEDGFFHADPHPGNLLIQDNHVLCLLDWGMVGRLTRDMRFDIIDLIHAMVERDSEHVLDTLLRFVSWDSSLDQRSLQRDLLDILDVYHKIPIRQINISQLLWEIAGLLRDYRLRVPRDMAIMIKALVTAEGTARQLYPDLNVVAEAEPYVKELALERWKPGVVWKSLRRSLYLILAMQRQVPERLGRIVEKVDRGELSILFQHRDLEGIRTSLENSTNRLTSGIIIAAMIIGSSMIITTGVKPLLFGYPAFGIIGYLISAVMGLWLLYDILRSRSS